MRSRSLHLVDGNRLRLAQNDERLFLQVGEVGCSLRIDEAQFFAEALVEFLRSAAPKLYDPTDDEVTL